MSETAQSSPSPEESARKQASAKGTGQNQTEHAVLSEHYHCLEKLGQGAQATMLKALDANNHPVAIKVFDFGNAGGWKDFDLFEREIEILKTLNIDGVPRYIETIKTDQKLYLVEEYIDAPSLEKQIKAGRRFTASECESILKNAATILQKLSEHIPPIIHRDIKPANLLVDNHLKVYLVDFGVVAKTNQTVSTTFAGTAGYVSPEQLYGKTTPASDIYSLGATILHLISHVAPSDMQLNGITPDFDKYIPESVPSWLSKTIKKMMSVDSSKRPQTGGELIAWIDKVKGERSQSESLAKEQLHSLAITDDDKTSPASLVKRYRRYGRRSTVMMVVLMLSFILLIAAPILFAVGGTNERNRVRELEQIVERARDQQMVHSLFKESQNTLALLGESQGTYDLHKDAGSAEKILGVEDYKELKKLQHSIDVMLNSFLIVFALSFIMIIICAIVVAVYDSRKKRLLSLPGLVDVNKELVENALKGDALSQYFIGRKYEIGDGAVQDERVAFAWYTLSAEGGCSEAQAKVDD